MSCHQLKAELRESLKSINDEKYRIINMEEAYHFSSRKERKGNRQRKLSKKMKVSIKLLNNHSRSQITQYTEIDHKQYAKIDDGYNYQDEYDGNNQFSENDNKNEIPSAESLGLQNDPMYKRLLTIIQGGDITPEDYDLLLLLDNNNVKKTMGKKEISEILVVVLGSGKDEELLQSCKSSTCNICLDSFQELPKGTEVRHLPCDHVFCKKCIDHWFSEVSTKCPNLSCYWQKESND